MLKIRRSWDLLIFNMGIPILVRRHLYIETSPWLSLMYVKSYKDSYMMYGINSLWPSGAIWWHRSGSILAQVMACCLTAPSHHLNQYWFIFKGVLWPSPEGNFIGRLNISIYMILKITNLRLQSHFTMDNELIWPDLGWETTFMTSQRACMIEMKQSKRMYSIAYFPSDIIEIYIYI